MMEVNHFKKEKKVFLKAEKGNISTIVRDK